MYCPKCAKSNSDDSNFCTKCGYNLKVVTPTGGIEIEQTRIREEDYLRQVLAGRYQIEEEAGRGGMAIVYRARELALNRLVAIKVLPRHLWHNEELVARFLDDAKTAAQLEHPNIVPIFRIGEEPDSCYFVMSYLTGGSLTKLLKDRGKLELPEIISMGVRIGMALSYAHDKGVIHRDIKPGNIMLDSRSRPVVTDFGIAKTTSRTWSTQAGYVIGSPSYMSPEQCLNRDVDGRSDLYSLGVVLYQMATGNLPFKGKDVATVIYQHVHEEPLAPDIYEPGLPAWLKDIILRCLDKDPESRLRNARDFCQALANRSSSAYPGSKPQVSVAADLPKDHKLLKWLKPNLPAVALLAAGGAAAAVDLRIAAVLVSTGGGLACYRCFAAVAKRKKEKKILAAQDDQAFKKAERINSIHAYRSYLKSYPNGLHAGKAIDELSFKEAKITNTSQTYRNYLKTFPEGFHVDKICARLDTLDNKAFDQASATGTEDSYLDYLARWPEGRHGKEAKEKLEKIVKAKSEQEASKQEEEKQFRQALIENKVSSYKKYLADFPEGLHAEEARENLHEMLYQKSLSSSTRKWCEEFLKIFPESEYRTEVRSKLTIIVKREEKEKLLGSLGIEMVSIPGGTFIMGSEDGADDAKPLHRVRLSGFKLSSTVITQSQYWEVLEEDPSFFKGDKLPIENVSYHDALNFCNRLREKTGQNFRLPTEAEWEYACRAGTSTRFSSGGDLANVGWFRANSRQKTQPVALKAPNEWELYDMHGNVWEWCSDWYDPGYYKYSPNNDPRGPDSGSSRVLRGGSWKDLAISCCSGARLSTAPATRTDNIGFRIVRV